MEKWVSKKTLSNREIRSVRTAIWLLLMVILLGSLALLVIEPTSTYWLNWEEKIRAKADTSYFGAQGSVLLVHTFPVLLFGALGCVYLHLGTKLENENLESKSKTHSLTIFKRPLLVKGPLGIVSGTELAFFIMFIALLIWSFSCYLHVSFSKFINPQLMASSKETKVWEAKLEWISFWLGGIGNICLVFLFFPVSRRSPVLPLFGLTSEGSIKYHIWLGHIAMLLFTAHGLGYIYLWAITQQLSELLEWAKTGVSNVAGELSLASGLVLWATTIPGVRHRFFELFLYTHHFYIPFLLFFVFHLGFPYACMMLPGLYLFLLDRCLRFLQSRSRIRLLSARLLPCKTLELTFSKSPDLRYNPTSIVFVNVPSISKLQWHPYTIDSSSKLETEQLSIVVKSEGTWSQKLYQILSSSSPHDRLQVAIEGPYGPASTQFLRHDTLVMVSGGSGITPFISIIRELIFYTPTAAAPPSPPLPRKLLLICAFKSSAGLSMLDLIVPSSGISSIAPGVMLQIEAYVTGEKRPTAEENPKQRVREVSFEPKLGSGEPISDVLGPNGWLWMGAIVAASFVLYLILLGLLTRFYIYPIDRNSFKVYPLAASSAFDMALVCLCVILVATAGVLWNKKQKAGGRKEDATAITAPETFCDGGKELESLPRQSLSQCTKVHYGERPDLKGILEKCKGSSVGVMVCGPKKMRHEVATICSSPSANYLHFESISFSW